nr:terminase small subunit [Flavihumibacter petaseus]
MDFKGKDADRVKLPRMRAYTLHGLCLYLDCSTSFFKDFKKTLKPKDKDFLPILTRIEEVIHQQKFTGAAASFLNAITITRNLGLSDKTDNTTGVDKLPAPQTTEAHRGNQYVKTLTLPELLGYFNYFPAIFTRTDASETADKLLRLSEKRIVR